MNPWLLGALTLANAWIAYGYFTSHRNGLAIAFSAYAIACLGYIIDIYEVAK